MTLQQSSPRTGNSLSGSVGILLKTLTTPLVPTDFLDMVAPLSSSADLRARVLEVRPETDQATTVVLRPGRGWNGHTPGQYVRIGIDVDGVRLWRAYSVTSPPNNTDRTISITVKAMADGKVSNHIRENLRPGALLHLDQAKGDFTLDRRHGKAGTGSLFLVGGSGITPAMGILRSHLDNALDDVTVIHCATNPEQALFAAELSELAALGTINLVEHYSDTDGQLDVAGLDSICPDWRDRHTWACGPQGLLDAAEEHWLTQGLPDQLTTEQFRPTLAAVGEGGTVTFNQDTVEAEGSTTILDAAEDSGILMPSGCRMGICFGCVLPLTEGAVRDLRSGELTAAAPGDSIKVQTCISAAAGACTFDH